MDSDANCGRTAIKDPALMIMTNGVSGDALISRIRRMIEQEYEWDVLDAPIPRRYGP
jgi:hypothetical protein